MTLTSQATSTIKSSLDSVTSNPDSGTPGLVFVSVDKNGKTLIEHASGTRGLDTKDPMTLDTTFWVASCTKMITGVACMQLVEKGQISLDDHNALYKLCPELEKMKILEDGKLVARKGDITLRQLLTHTAGFGYEFFDPRIKEYGKQSGKEFDVFTGDVNEILRMPLVNEPGSAWEYGINIDWAGIVVERLSGLSLDEYFKKNILAPLGLKNITFYPTKEMKSNIAGMQQRAPDGKTSTRKHLYATALAAETEEQKRAIFNSGGAGCFAKPVEYVQILATLLNGGVSPTTQNRILKKETVDSMFENQIPQWPDFARGLPDPADTTLANPAPEFYPQGGNPPQGWGLTFFLTIKEGETGRGRNTAFWAGISNQFWWCDREKGVAGMICGQVLPFGDPQVLGQWFACEKALYDGLEK